MPRPSPVTDAVRSLVEDAGHRTWSLDELLLAVREGIPSANYSTILRAFHGQDRAIKRADQLQVLQFTVMRFADEYAGCVIEPVQRVQAGTQNATERLAAQTFESFERGSCPVRMSPAGARRPWPPIALLGIEVFRAHVECPARNPKHVGIRSAGGGRDFGSRD